ncbi:MAG: hypothetical protein ACFFG0_08540 [Candidatus Thorarchaeota archaeon]
MSFTSVVAPPPPAVEKPTFFVTLYGEKVYGDIDSLQSNDGDIIHWRGNYYSASWWLWMWILEVELFFDDPGYSYPYVILQVEFKYDGADPLKIVVFYDQGGTDTFEESSTGGNYVIKTYTLDSYKTVDTVIFHNGNFFIRPYLYVDFCHIGYSSFQ